MKLSTRLFGSLFAVAVATAFAQAQVPPAQNGRWISLLGQAAAPLPQAIERLVLDTLRRDYQTISVSSTTPADLSLQLASRSRSDIIFVAGRPADFAQFIQKDSNQLATKLGLEIVNARLGVTPFYLFTNAQKQPNLAGTPSVIYASRAGTIEKDQVTSLVNVALNLLNVKSASPSVSPALNSPRQLAQLLLGSGPNNADVVAIYDEDPSPFLNQFLTEYEQLRATLPGGNDRQRLLQMMAVPSKAQDGQVVPNQLQSSGDLSYALVRFDDVAFDDLQRVSQPKDGVLAVSATSASDASGSLLVLSNVRTAVNEAAYQQLRRILGDAYFVGLMANLDFRGRCQANSQTYSAYLMDAQLSDRTSVAKALAFWSDIALRTGVRGATERERLREQQALVAQVLRERLKVPVDDGKEIAKKLQGLAAGTRQAFSNQSATLFKQAQGDLLLAMQSSNPSTRASWLALARAKLITLIENGNGPACSGGDGGLFGRGLDPFFYVGLIDAYTALESPTAAVPALPR